MQGGDHFVFSRDADDGRITRRESGDPPAEERDDDGVPFRAFRFLRGDELDRIPVRQAGRPLAFHFGTQTLREIGQGGAGCGRFGGQGHKGIEVGERILKVFRRKRSQPRPQSRASDQLLDRREERQLLNSAANLGELARFAMRQFPPRRAQFRFESARRGLR